MRWLGALFGYFAKQYGEAMESVKGLLFDGFVDLFGEEIAYSDLAWVWQAIDTGDYYFDLTLLFVCVSAYFGFAATFIVTKQVLKHIPFVGG